MSWPPDVDTTGRTPTLPPGIVGRYPAGRAGAPHGHGTPGRDGVNRWAATD